MKTFNKILALAITAVLFTACGNNNPNNQGIVGYNANGTPIYGTTGTTVGVAGCIPLQSASAIPFSATGAQVSATEIMAGMLPTNSLSPGQHGTVVLSSAYQGQVQGVNGYSQLAGTFTQGGTIQMTASTGGMLQGTIQFNAQGMSQLMASTGYSGYNTGYPYNTGASAQQCITNIAIDATYQSSAGYTGYTSYASSGQIIIAIVYVTLSTGQTLTIGFR